MKVKIVSDGKAMNTKVVDIKTGEMLEGVVGIEWRMNELSDNAQATITVVQVPIEVTTEANLFKRKRK